MITVLHQAQMLDMICKQSARGGTIALTKEGLTAVMVQYESSFHVLRCSLVPKPLLGNFFVTWSTARAS